MADILTRCEFHRRAAKHLFLQGTGGKPLPWRLNRFHEPDHIASIVALVDGPFLFGHEIWHQASPGIEHQCEMARVCRTPSDSFLSGSHGLFIEGYHLGLLLAVHGIPLGGGEPVNFADLLLRRWSSAMIHHELSTCGHCCFLRIRLDLCSAANHTSMKQTSNVGRGIKAGRSSQTRLAIGTHAFAHAVHVQEGQTCPYSSRKNKSLNMNGTLWAEWRFHKSNKPSLLEPSLRTVSLRLDWATNLVIAAWVDGFVLKLT